MDFLKRFLDISDDLFCTLDANGFVVFINSAWKRELGWDHDSLIGLPYNLFCSNIETSLVSDYMLAIQRNEKVKDITVKIKSRSGDSFYYQWKGKRCLESGFCYLILRNVHDEYSKYRKDKNKQEQSLKLLDSFIKEIPIPICLLSKEMNLITYSKKWQDDFTHSKYAKGECLYDLFSPNTLMRRHFQKILLGSSHENFEIENKFKENTSEWIKWSLVPWKSGKNEISGVMVIAEITTEKRRLLADLEKEKCNALGKSQMANLGEMAAGVAHEIKNPLTITLAHLKQIQKLLQRKEQGTERFANYLEKAIGGAVRINSIVKGLKVYSRDGTSDPFIDSSLVNIINDSLAMTEGRIKQLGIDLRVEVPTVSLSAVCRPVQISQVLVNLLVNSRDAIEELEEKWISLKVVDMDDQIKIVVTDSGAGIEESVKVHLMQPFFTTKEAGKGTGLGLSLSKSIAKEHNGRFYYDEGNSHTSFVLLLPKSHDELLKAS